MSASFTTPPVDLTEARVRALLEAVRDPEIPVLTIADLGILRGVDVRDGRVRVIITPTYSGCPAMRTIERDVADALGAAGIDDFEIETRLSPAWTTDWLTDAGREKLRSVGISPPAQASADKRALRGASGAVSCPRCGSVRTGMVSEFGSTACKALFRCSDCLEPFDYFKCL